MMGKQALKCRDAIVANTTRHRSILLVDDSEENLVNLKTALKDAGEVNPVHRFAGSQAASGTFSTEVRAEIQQAVFVLIDLGVTGVDGRELLTSLRQRERRLPLIVLSTSRDPETIAFCYRVGVNGYLIKPSNYDQWKEMIRMLAAYWLHTAVLPPVHHAPVALAKHHIAPLRG